MPCGKAFAELFAIERRTQEMPLQRKVLPNRTKAGQECLSAFRITEAAHAALAFSRRLMAILGTVIHPRAGLDEDVFDAGKFGYLGFRRWMAAELVSHNLARRLRARR